MFFVAISLFFLLFVQCLKDRWISGVYSISAVCLCLFEISVSKLLYLKKILDAILYTSCGLGRMESFYTTEKIIDFASLTMCVYLTPCVCVHIKGRGAGI